jgi:hypothetical protein
MFHTQCNSKTVVLIQIIRSMIHVLDQPCSFSIMMPKQAGLVGDAIFLSADLSMNTLNNTVIFAAMVDVIKKSEQDKVSTRSCV